MQPRSPIVTILGHVDHGKTSLLDYIRKSHLTEKEYGGITQRIGAYEITLPLKGYQTNKITFIDTPGHEAFSQLRARGANVADIAILIIDAKDSLMPQTIESIAHIKNAQLPFIVALNKIDLPDANPEKVKNDLLKYEVVTESKGGKVPTVNISAKTGQGVDELLESLLLIAADLNLTYDPTHDAKAFIIETKKDKRGIVASAIMKDGLLKLGDNVYNESKKTKIRAMINDVGQPISEVLPSMPFELLGFEDMPQVGELISNKPITPTAATTTEENESRPTVRRDIAALYGIKNEEKKLSLVIKTDSQGTLEAILQTLAKNQTIEVILSAVGDINRSDVFLAKTSKAIIIGFDVGIPMEVRELAKQEKVIIKTYNIIYELIEELTEVSRLMREKEEKEKSIKGEAKIMTTFIIEGEKIFGIKVTKGKINLGDSVQLYRDSNLIGKTRLVSLKQRAKTVNEVKKDQEAGMVFGPPLDIKTGDVVEFIL